MNNVLWFSGCINSAGVGAGKCGGMKMKFMFDTDLINRCRIKKPYTALVFSYLLEYCKENNGSFDKSILFLTAELKLARKTVYEAISELMRKQYLIKEISKNTNKKVPNVYKINFNKIEATKKNKSMVIIVLKNVEE